METMMLSSEISSAHNFGTCTNVSCDMWVVRSPEKLRWSIAIGPRPTSFVVTCLLTIEHFSFYWKLFKFNVKYLWGKGNLNRKNQDGDGVNSANIWAIFKTLPQWKKKWIYSYANQVDCKFHDFRRQGFSGKSVVNGYTVVSSITLKSSSLLLSMKQINWV